MIGKAETGPKTCLSQSSPLLGLTVCFTFLYWPATMWTGSTEKVKCWGSIHCWVSKKDEEDSMRRLFWYSPLLSKALNILPQSVPLEATCSTFLFYLYLTPRCHPDVRQEDMRNLFWSKTHQMPQPRLSACSTSPYCTTWTKMEKRGREEKKRLFKVRCSRQTRKNNF